MVVRRNPEYLKVSVLPSEGTVAFGGNGEPPGGLFSRSSFCEPGEGGQHCEILNGENERTRSAGERSRETQITFPKTAKTRDCVRQRCGCAHSHHSIFHSVAPLRLVRKTSCAKRVPRMVPRFFRTQRFPQKAVLK